MSLLTVVISRSPSQDPRKRELEERILAEAAREAGVAVAAAPHLYDLGEKDAATTALRSVSGPLLVLAWFYPRAIHWTLDRLGVSGRRGETQLPRAESEKENFAEKANAPDSPSRTLWTLDLRDGDNAEMHIAEIQRIARELRAAPVAAGDTSRSAFQIPLSEPAARRWYPVIDFGRCTHCMECLDFCLFGVYGVSDEERIVVESPESCKKGCPACSRVCPENAIIFPMHRTPAIAGAFGAGIEARKLDLSEVFGAPAAAQLAAAERDAALASSKQEAKPRDNLDKLMDALDDAKL